MDASGGNPWAFSSRSLTKFGTGAYITTLSAHTVISNGTQVVLNFGSGVDGGIVNILGEAAANATYAIAHWDGTALRIFGQGTINNSLFLLVSGLGNGTTGLTIQNSGSASGFYTICGSVFQGS